MKRCIVFIAVVLVVVCNAEKLNLLKTLDKETFKANETTRTETTSKKGDSPVTIIFAGDISLDKPIRKDNGSSCEYSGLLANVSKYFASVDYNMVNLEAPFVDRVTSKKTFLPDKGIHNMAWPEGIEALTSAGIKGATIANNHMGDFGGDSVLLTQQILQENNIDVIGMTTGEKPPYSSQKPLIKEIKGVKIGFLAYCGDSNKECLRFRPGIKAGPALLDKKTAEQDIPKLKEKVDVVVLFLHWGKEYMAIPNEPQREVAIYLKKLGVDLIIGSHPHVMQGHEWMNDTLIHYSLGNFVFHPHFTFMGALHGKKNKTAIHDKYIQMSKKSRGPAGITELFKVELTQKGIKDAYYLPIRIHVDRNTACLYPRAKIEDNWLKVCGPEDDNCYVPRPGEPIY